MFDKWKKKSLTAEIARLKEELGTTTQDADKAKAELRTTKDQLEDLKLKKKIETEDIKHMIKMKEERNAVDNERKGLELQREKDKEVAEVKDKYRDKLESFLVTQVKDTKEMYSEILGRLPDVKVKLKGSV